VGLAATHYQAQGSDKVEKSEKKLCIVFPQLLFSISNDRDLKQKKIKRGVMNIRNQDQATNLFKPHYSLDL
jgi:hypothetical protein